MEASNNPVSARQQPQAAKPQAQSRPSLSDILSRMMFLEREIIMQLRVQNRLRDGVFEFPYKSRRFKLALPDASSDLTQRTIVDNGTFKDLEELENLADMLSPGAVIIDAGANIGNHTIYLASMVKDAHVHSFEPLAHCYSTLAENIRLNGLDSPRKVTPYCAALGNTDGKAEIAAWATTNGEVINVGGTRLRESESGEFSVVTIDSLGLERLDLLKIDVEGMQLEVLKGGAETIKRCMPVIFIELLPGPQAHTRKLWSKDNEVDAPLRLLWDYGYKSKQVTQMDWLALPRDPARHPEALRKAAAPADDFCDNPQA